MKCMYTKKPCLYFVILIVINMDRILVTLCCKKNYVKLKAGCHPVTPSVARGRERGAACSASHLLLCRVDRVGII